MNNGAVMKYSYLHPHPHFHPPKKGYVCGLWSVRLMVSLSPDCQEHLKSDSTSNDS